VILSTCSPFFCVGGHYSDGQIMCCEGAHLWKAFKPKKDDGTFTLTGKFFMTIKSSLFCRLLFRLKGTGADSAEKEFSWRGG